VRALLLRAGRALRGAAAAVGRGSRRLLRRLARERPPEPPPRSTPEWMWRHARRLIVIVIGGTTVLLGVVMLVTPGPAVVVIPLGVAILASEFVLARRLLRWLEKKLPGGAAPRQRSSIARRSPSAM
jgi:hypothetical protein